MDAPITAKAALLQVLAEKPGFGLDLIARVRQRSNGALELAQGSAYPALRALEREKLVKKSTNGAQRDEECGGRPRQYYQITERGRAVANEQREAVMSLFRTK